VERANACNSVSLLSPWASALPPRQSTAAPGGAAKPCALALARSPARAGKRLHPQADC
jgi:hypothetical protein